MSTTSTDHEYAGQVTASLRHPRSGIEGPALVFVETEHLGYVPLAVDQAADLASRLQELVTAARA